MSSSDEIRQEYETKLKTLSKRYKLVETALKMLLKMHVIVKKN